MVFVCVVGCPCMFGHVDRQHICLDARCQMQAGCAAVRRAYHTKECPHCYAHDIPKDNSVKTRVSALIWTTPGAVAAARRSLIPI